MSGPSWSTARSRSSSGGSAGRRARPRSAARRRARAARRARSRAGPTRRSARRRRPRGARRPPATRTIATPPSAGRGVAAVASPRSRSMPCQPAPERTERESNVRQLPSAWRRRTIPDQPVGLIVGVGELVQRAADEVVVTEQRRARGVGVRQRAVLVDGPDPVRRVVDQRAVGRELVQLAPALRQLRAQRFAVRGQPGALGLQRRRALDRASAARRKATTTTATSSAPSTDVDDHGADARRPRRDQVTSSSVAAHGYQHP